MKAFMELDMYIIIRYKIKRRKNKSFEIVNLENQDYAKLLIHLGKSI